MRVQEPDPDPARRVFSEAAVGEGDYPGWAALFPTLDVREHAFHLLYKQHGGSGLDLDYDAVMDMEFNEIEWWVEKLNNKREQEADALKGPTTG